MADGLFPVEVWGRSRALPEASTHICTVHEVGEHEGQAFIVMEHVDGETLAQQLEKGTLPPNQALRRRPL